MPHMKRQQGLASLALAACCDAAAAARALGVSALLSRRGERRRSTAAIERGHPCAARPQGLQRAVLPWSEAFGDGPETEKRIVNHG